MGWLYCGLNLLCLAILIRQRYWQLWPACVAWQAVNCWQIGVTLFVPVADRALNIRWWIPGEALLLILMVLAVAEGLSRSMRDFSRFEKSLVICGLNVTGISLALGIEGMLHGNWYTQFLHLREMLFFGQGVVAVIGFGMAVDSLVFPRSPRAVRMQLALYAALMCGHVVLVDWTHWRKSMIAYRLLELLVCAGFVINSRFLATEIEQARRFLDAVLSSPDWSRSPLAGSDSEPPEAYRSGIPRQSTSPEANRLYWASVAARAGILRRH